MNNASIETFSQKFAANKELESILYYPHPFTKGGIILVCQNDISDFLALVAEAYANQPSSLSLHCVRRGELFQLSLPGLFAPPLQVNERTHLPYWLKYKGVVLAGVDLRHEVDLPTDPTLLLAGHIEGCMDYLRRYGILTALIHKENEALVSMLAREMRYLMGTALLIHDVWDVSLETLPVQFEAAFPDSKPMQIWQKFQLEQDKFRQAAAPQLTIEMVWLFEQFLHALREYIS